MSDDTSSHVRVSHLYDELLSIIIMQADEAAKQSIVFQSYLPLCLSVCACYNWKISDQKLRSNLVGVCVTTSLRSA